MKIKIQKLHENAVTPTYAHQGDAYFELTAVTVDSLYHVPSPISGGESVICGTGLAFEIPEGHVMLVFSRSGHGFKHGIRLDAGYAREVMVKLTCDLPEYDERPPVLIRPGDRIAQAMIIPVESVDFEVVEQLQLTERGTSGFGGSGS